MNRQRGVALITVLLVVAVVTVVCSGLIARQQLAIRSSTNMLVQRQAWHYAQGGEALAKALLLRDLRQGEAGPAVDHLGEPWAAPLKTFALDEGGELRVRIEDLSGRFNLNSLVREGRLDRVAFERFQRLLRRLNIGAPYAGRLRDWLDFDEQVSVVNGAEDNDYLLLKPPYRAANRPLADVSELRLLLGMREQDYRLLLPYVSALPPEAALNVNTASALVLSSLAEELSPDVVLALVAARGARGFRTLEEFFAQLGPAAQHVKARKLAVGSQFFQVISEVEMGTRRQVLVSLLQRGGDGGVRVLARDLGQSGLLPITGKGRSDD